MRDAVSLLGEMLKLGVQPNEATVSTLLNGCFAHGNVSAARHAAEIVRAHAHGASDEALAHAVDSSMIVGLCRSAELGEARDPGRLREALKLFVSRVAKEEAREAREAREAEEARAAREAEEAEEAEEATEPEEAEEVVAEPQRRAGQETRAEQVRLATVEETATARPRRAGRARRRGGRTDSRVPLMGTRTCNALLSALVALGELSSATRVLQAMDAGAAEPPNAYTLCIMMRAHGGRVDMRRAEDLWQRLETQGWIDTVGLNTWLQVCLSAGAPARALQAFQRAKVDLPALRFDTVRTTSPHQRTAYHRTSPHGITATGRRHLPLPHSCRAGAKSLGRTRNRASAVPPCTCLVTCRPKSEAWPPGPQERSPLSARPSPPL